MDLDNLASQHLRLGEIDEALKHSEKAIGIRRQLHAGSPGSRKHALNLVQAISHLGAIQRQAGRVAAARASFASARELLEKHAAAHPYDTAIPGLLGGALTDEAVAIAEEQTPETARPLLARAIEILTPLGSTPAARPDDRERLSEVLWQSARIDRAIGSSPSAASADARRLALWKLRPPAELANLALKNLARATLIGYGRSPVPDQLRPIRDRDLDLAASDLHLAFANGFNNLAMLRSHPDASLLLDART